MYSALNAYRSTQIDSVEKPTRARALAEAYTALDQAIGQCHGTDLDIDPASRQMAAVKARLLILGLLAGIEPGVDPLAANLRGLLRYLLDSFALDDPARWETARGVAAHLKEAFVSIEDEGTRLERLGAIPSLRETGGLSLRA